MNITWLDLYNFLHDQANSINNIGKFSWNDPIIIHDAETGEEYGCDTYFISSKTHDEKPVIVINSEHIFC